MPWNIPSRTHSYHWFAHDWSSMLNGSSVDGWYTIWLFNIAMENPLYIEVLMGQLTINGPFSTARVFWTTGGLEAVEFDELLRQLSLLVAQDSDGLTPQGLSNVAWETWWRNPAVDGWFKRFIQFFIGFQHVSTILLVVQDFATIHSMFFFKKNWVPIL